ncbi:MAG: IS1595 family transposase [Flavobacteriales bacterium]|nr:IS1595 family transposase [Flavobacteriales bacterium]MBE7441905.1 IS1595 family transposase [Flavobacteriales bacterium]MBE7442267.1 IS1595 family transposase [Flavobacteriales bacterium]
MNIHEIYKTFPTQKDCLNHLEYLRWKDEPVCVNCGSTNVTKFKSELRWHCNDENKSFSVLKDTIFEGTRLPLQKWFYAIHLMLSAKKGLSAMQLSRNLDVSWNTAWYTSMRIRCAMQDQSYILEGIIQSDSTYIGGKPRKTNKKVDRIKHKRGKGADKEQIIGYIEKKPNGKVIAKHVKKDTETLELLNLLKSNIKADRSVLITDEGKEYTQEFDKIIQRYMVKHKDEFSSYGLNTNTIESFWAIIKRGITGQYHHLSKRYLPFYISEFAYRYNNRNNKQMFHDLLNEAVEDEKCFINMKPKKGVKSEL